VTAKLWPPRPDDTPPAAPAWTAMAACQYTDPDSFYPEPGGYAGEPQKAICRSCQARPDCLLDAAVRREEFGIWGGFSERQRWRPDIRAIATRSGAEDVIAADDARFYARQDAAQARAQAAYQRELAAERARRQAAIAALAAVA
jgi:WhiB family redox-sensing transcriptional regulator